MRGNEREDHHGSHRDLLRAVGDSPSNWPGLHAIVVPTARDPGHLAEAARLARSLKCTLVTLHSGKRTTAAWTSELLPPDIDLIAIDVAAPVRLRLPHWETSRLLSQTIFARRSDLSTKRNLALMLGRMLGWSRILFLDDDITAVNPDEIRWASGLLEGNNAVGLHINGFPDHSVVCHAYRLAGGDQLSFIGGGALAVQTERCNSFFPDIYNDDWFFMLDPQGLLQPVTQAGRVCQDSFNPFRSPDRARAEEFGDILAEGTYWLLDQGQSVFRADQKHWTAFLIKRRQFIERVLDMTKRHNFERSEKRRMIAALKGSLGRLTRITPDLCERYLQAWASDRELWQRHLNRLSTGRTHQQAVSLLSAPGAPPLAQSLRKEHVIGRSRVSVDPAL